MDASLLIDPSFWAEQESCVPGTFPGALPPLPALRSHVLFETSGSTGRPKWIALSKQALLLSAATVNRHLRVDGSSCWGLPLPLHHVGGFGVMARAFEAACRFSVFGQRWEPHAFTQWLAHRGVTHTSLVPAQVHDVVQAGLRAPEALAAIVVGGGHLDPTTGRAARELGWPVLASYGMTEACSQIATQGPEFLELPYRPAPLPLLPIWSAARLPDGRLRLRGPALFSGMLLREKNGWHYHPRAGEWHETSDRVSLADNAITPVGRADAVVKILGELVDPEAIERELRALSGFRWPANRFAVAALPDARAGHRLVPVLEPFTTPETAAPVLAAYQRQAPGFRRLQPPVFVERLPRSPLGKILRSQLASLCP